jgi:hypothetical protein
VYSKLELLGLQEVHGLRRFLEKVRVMVLERNGWGVRE